MKKILILGVAAVQSDAIELLKEMGYETYACAMANDGPGAEIADYFEEINILDIERLKAFIMKNKIDVVYSVGSDLAMPIACKISEELELPHFISSIAAQKCNNKDMMRLSLGNDCPGNIPFQIIKDIDTVLQLKMPFIMKPTDSQGQRGIVLVNQIDDYTTNFEFVKKYSRSGKVIIEKYIQGPELSVNAYLVNGKLEYLIASDRETWPNYTGLIHKHIVPSKVLKRKTHSELKDVIINACSRIGITNGPVYFQIKIQDDLPYIIEMTPRLDGCHMWKLLEYHSKVNILKLTLDHLISGNISELKNNLLKYNDFELEFICQEPNTLMESNNYNIPDTAKTHFFYYKNGDIIRPVNGKYEKIGYFITSQENN